jgi:hypothetical protein
MEVLRDLWSEFEALPFPDRLPRDLDPPLDLEALATTAIECIQSYMWTGVLDPEANGALRACAQALANVRPQLRGDTAQYFGKLAEMVENVLTRPHRSPFYGG